MEGTAATPREKGVYILGGNGARVSTREVIVGTVAEQQGRHHVCLKICVNVNSGEQKIVDEQVVLEKDSRAATNLLG